MNGDDVFFTSDTHFGHKAILQYTDRPYANTYEMDEALVEAWNSTVPPGAHVYHLGDISFHSPGFFLAKILPRLNGFIHVVEGNHDKALRKHADRFASWSKLENVKVDGRMLVLCHFPLLSWEGRHKGWWHLHGHCHGNLPEDPSACRLDVGVDTLGFRPVSYWKIYGKLIDRVDRPVDHHR